MPWRIQRSRWLSATASTETRTSHGPGVRSGSSSRTSLSTPPCSRRVIAFMGVLYSGSEVMDMRRTLLVLSLFAIGCAGDDGSSDGEDVSGTILGTNPFPENSKLLVSTAGVDDTDGFGWKLAEGSAGATTFGVTPP